MRGPEYDRSSVDLELEAQAEARTFRRRILPLFVLLGSILPIGIAGWQFWDRARRIRVEIGPETTVISSPLRPDGFVDYRQELNRRRSEGVTLENNAFVLIVDAIGPEFIPGIYRAEYFAELGIPNLKAHDDNFLTPIDFELRLADRDDQSRRELIAKLFEEAVPTPWDRTQKPLVAGYLAQNDRALALVTKAVLRPEFYAPMTAGNCPIATHGTPAGIQNLREVSRALVLRAMLHLGEGRVEDCWRDLMTIRRLAQLLKGDDITLLVRVSLLRHCVAGVAALVGSGQLDAERAGRYREEWIAAGEWGDLAEHVDIETRYSMLDAIEFSYAEPGHVRWTARHGVDVNIMLREMNRYVDAFAAAVRDNSLPEGYAILVDATWERPAPHWAEALFSRRAAVSRTVTAELIEIQMQSRKAFYVAYGNGEVLLKLTALGLRAAEYRARYRTWPDSIEALRIALPEEASTDPWTAAPFRYSKRDDGFVLYSVDSDLEDNGGMAQGAIGRDVVFEVQHP